MVPEDRKDAGRQLLTQIKFGTSGWRGIIADDFTFERSRLVVAAVAHYLSESGDVRRGVLVGHDTRFLAEEFAADAAGLLSDLGIDVLLCSGPVPTPAISLIILKRGLGGGINFTASHNPSSYQGIKFSPSWGGPALPESTRIIEGTVEKYQLKGLPPATAGRGSIETIDPVPEYLEQLRSKVDMDVIARSGLKIGFDALYGAGGNYLDRVLEEGGCKVKTIHGNRDPLFGGFSPEPSEERLSELARIVSAGADLGLSTDGDADRFGILGNRGEFYTPNSILAILADYLLRVKGTRGDLARSVATTGQLDDIAAAFGRRCHETPVGFKYIGQMISEGKLAMGGEESAGMSIRGHVPEKDGILACLLVAELVASTGKPLSEISRELQNTYGVRLSVRVNLLLTDELVLRLRKILSSPPIEVGGFTAAEMVTVDGTKWVYEGGDWVLLRLSGTEPVARLYVEARDQDRLTGLERAFSSWITGEGDVLVNNEAGRIK
jgi:alpha-D-glucose phosphate-specific phosphoglucomutase